MLYKGELPGVIETVALAENADPAVGDIVTLSGWGKNSDSAPGVTDKLRMVDAPIISNAQCRETYGNTIYDGTICISSAGGKGVCSVRFLCPHVNVASCNECFLHSGRLWWTNELEWHVGRSHFVRG